MSQLAFFKDMPCGLANVNNHIYILGLTQISGAVSNTRLVPSFDEFSTSLPAILTQVCRKVTGEYFKLQVFACHLNYVTDSL